MQIIENTTTLNALCQKLGREEFITIDLEFLREKTYYAHVCLIQVASPNEAAIIDPLAPGIELDDFFALLKNPRLPKFSLRTPGYRNFIQTLGHYSPAFV